MTETSPRWVDWLPLAGGREKECVKEQRQQHRGGVPFRGEEEERRLENGSSARKKDWEKKTSTK